MEREYQKYFSHDIWQEGISCVKEKKVKRMKHSTASIDAIVEDQKECHIHITKNPWNMKCTCDYAQEGNRCRHMAAVCLAYEVIQEKKTKEKKALKSYPDTSWYAFFKSGLNKKGEVIDDYALYHALEEYLETPLEQLHCSTNQYLEDLVFLLLFIINKITSYRSERMLNQCIDVLYQYRISIDAHSKKILDQKIFTLIRKANHEDLNTSLLLHYFSEKEDYPIFIAYAKKAGTLYKYTSILLMKMQQIGSEPSDIELLCSTCIMHKDARNWIISYYKETKQYEKGIQLLENYCNHLALKSTDITKEQCDLFVFYSCAKRSVSSNELFQILSKDRHVKKSDLFYSLKESMSEEEWRDRGKKLVHTWCQGKSQATCCDIYQRIDAPDLMMQDILSQGWNLRLLSDHHNFLVKQDPGLVYTMYYGILKDLIQKHAFTSVNYEFLYDYPDSEEDIFALKIMLVKLQKEFSHQRDVLDFLERIEEAYYDET